MKNPVEGKALDKDRVLEEAKQSFSATNAKTKKLIDVLTKALLMILQEDSLNSTEATNLFFHVTNLFQYKNKDNTLRRLIYITIKELSKQADNVYAVASTLSIDVTSSRDNPNIKAAALRTLLQISDVSIFNTFEQSLKRCILDDQAVVSSSALVSLLRFARNNSKIVLSCDEEVKKVLNSDSPMVQYHALVLRYVLCKNNRLSLATLIEDCLKRDLTSPMALCLLIKIIVSYIMDDKKEEKCVPYISFVKKCLNNKSEMVEYEAARSLINLCKPDTGDTTGAIAHLRGFLSSPKRSLRFASLRLLNSLTVTNEARYWSIHRIGKVCKLHLLNKRHRVGDHVVGILDFNGSTASCAKYIVLLKRDDGGEIVVKQEFSFGLKKCDFMLTIPQVDVEDSFEAIDNEIVSHCILRLLFCIVDSNYTRTMYEDRAGVIELGPNELETKLFSCDFPIAVYR